MSRIHSWIKRFAEGEYDAALVGMSVFGLVMGALVALSIIMESQP